MNAKDAPQSLAELDQWTAAVETMEEADRAARITNKGTVNARAAVDAARGGRS